ncbi:putative threonine-rich GPI-anchored glyco isoform X2 [Labeo rohita]|uniref:Putative threonine-rich GPI-anchored glyco isoform X2 n=1 Tax=Labeo rohita TaxID=84645 RepID=A0A498NA59_LABRO|nr:putative threonine-rich GPI-anchored glyco isoform X2 [Labeo rohita]
MLGYLKQHHPWSSTCGSRTSSLSAWLEESFGKFSIYVDYKDLRDLNTGFDSFESLDLLSASQVAQLTLHSGALNNAHLMEMVFDRLDGGNSFQDVEEFLEALSRSSQDLDINHVVRDIMMNRTFTIISLHFADFLSYDWVSWFTVKLVPLLPRLTAEMLQTVTANTDCNAYHVIVGALSSVFGQMTSLRQQELSQVMLGYLKQHHPWSSTCGSSTSSLSAWREESFGKFSIYVDYKDLRDLHTGFDSFESLDLLSASQVAQLTLHSGALNNAHLMEMGFDRLEGGNSFQDVEEFLEALSRSSQDLDINPVVRDIMMNRTFAIISLHFADILSYDWVSWFTFESLDLLSASQVAQLTLHSGALNNAHLMEMVFDRLEGGNSFQDVEEFLEALSRSSQDLDINPVVRDIMMNRTFTIISLHSPTPELRLGFLVHGETGSSPPQLDCRDAPDSNSKHRLQRIPRHFESLDLLSASQVAQLTLHSGALNNAHLMEMVFDRLEGGNSFQDVEEFLEALSRSSQDLDINPVVRDIMMNRTFAIISLHFADFLSYDWVSWFTVKLVPLLPRLTAEMLQTVTANTDCNAYHVIVGALSSVFGQMTSLRQQELTQVMLGYLKQHHPWSKVSSTCGSSTSSLSAWLEESFGKFSIYVDYKDLRDLNTGFDSFESLDLLSASQVAQLPLHSGALNNAHLMEMVFARLEGGNSFQDVEEFLEALSRSSQDLDINPVVRDIMMNRTFAIISLHFADFLSYDWVSWFTVKLVPLLPSLTAEMLQTVTANTDCNAYHVIVGALSSVFGQMTSLRQQELTQVMLGYLKQHHPWSSTCGSSTSSLSAWLEESFGKFSIYVDYKDLRDLHTGFDSFESLDLLSASHVAQLTLHSGALNNAHLMEMVFDRLEGGNSFQDVEEFLEALSRSSQDLDINPVVRDIMMNRTFTIISLHFADFLSYDWVSWFTVKLVPLLPA